MPTPLIEVKNLTKTYKDVIAVRDISFFIPEGICFGLLGPNGAGKTTAIEIIEGILSPTSGEILYKGKPRDASFQEDVGIQLQHTALFSFLTVRETLAAFQKLYHHAADLNQILSLCNLTEIEHQYNDRISGGQRQRLLLALALINDPPLLFLDEPSTGMDPQARRNLWDIVHHIKSEGRTIVLTTHYMEEAEYLCDDIAIMDHGTIMDRGPLSDLLQRHCHDNSGLPFCQPNLENVFLRLTGRQLRD
ncbi:MAG: ABC transporter ATP-binding protein [Desulfatirhabdiaceae bacterium]